MNIDWKTVGRFALIIVSGILTTAITVFEVKDAVAECKETYHEELEKIVDERFENRANAS